MAVWLWEPCRSKSAFCVWPAGSAAIHQGVVWNVADALACSLAAAQQRLVPSRAAGQQPHCRLAHSESSRAWAWPTSSAHRNLLGLISSK